MIKNRKTFFFLLFFLNSCAGSSIPSMVGNAFFSEKGFYKSIDDGLIYTKIKANILSLGLKLLAILVYMFLTEKFFL